MTNKDIQCFAEALVRLVRDRAIRNCSTRLDPNTLSPIGKNWIALLSEEDLNQAINTIISDCVDETIFCLLNAIDENRLKFKFTTSSGNNVDLTTEGLGELAGWYMGVESWREEFSDERINDYLS